VSEKQKHSLSRHTVTTLTQPVYRTSIHTEDTFVLSIAQS